MSNSRTVRASRDGDQFHYLWAARRCLRLLSSSENLVAITIEGASPFEGSLPTEQVEAGEEIIDVGEYYGDENFDKASRVRYVQLKHSTLRADQQWQPSELENTLHKFAERYLELERIHGAEIVTAKLEFWFVSNRRIGVDFLESVADAADDAQSRHPENLRKLEKFTGLIGLALPAFAKLLRFDDNADGFWEQRNRLFQDVSGYLADADGDAPMQLKELVTRKASSEGVKNPTITRMDVLLALKTQDQFLFPAPCLIDQIDDLVPREQEAILIGEIVDAENSPVIVHASAGIGKSIFSTRIQTGLPHGSVAIVYDCFGSGDYRTASSYRHRHKDALVQIANELAGKGLCDVLVPTSRADASAYAKAFLHRLKQSTLLLRAENRNAVLCLIIDAADNAETAAKEIGEARSFVQDLISEQIPAGIRLVFTCRTQREPDLNPPPTALRRELRPFSREETAQYLRQKFPNSTENDVDEFHWLSSHNPRVQAGALSQKLALSEILHELGPNPTTVESTIEKLLERAVARARNQISVSEREQLDAVCTGLAVLRPIIPIAVLASLSGVDAVTVRSFVLDLGRALILTGDSIQFRDEPSETWFQDHFKTKPADLTSFIERLKPLAASSAYVAAVLPQLMLEADRFAELVALALSSEALPANNPIERRDVELQRLQFALKASLRRKQYADAAKLALKAGGASAGNERQARLLQSDTDLAARFLDPDRIRDITARGVFGSQWFGSHNAYEAGLLSAKSEFAGEARSRLRVAEAWLGKWSSRPKKEREREEVSLEDIAEMAIAHFNIHGALDCAKFVRRWRPRNNISFGAGRILARRFVDHCRYEDLDALATAGRNDLGLVLAIALELREVRRNPPKDVVLQALRLLEDRRVILSLGRGWNAESVTVEAVTSIVESGYRLGTRTNSELAALLTHYLPASPPRGLHSRYSGERFPLLRAYSLRAALLRQPLELTDLAHDEVKKAQSESRGSYTAQAWEEFEASVGVLLPWHRLWAEVFTGRIPGTNFANAVDDTQSASSKKSRTWRRAETETSDEITLIWLEALLETNGDQVSSVAVLTQWITSQTRPLFIPTLTKLARITARTGSLARQALDFAGRALDILKGEREDAESIAASYVDLSRTLLSLSPTEANAYFDEAVTVASKFGDEIPDRWSAILLLADPAGDPSAPAPEIAYKLARSAELAHRYVRDKHFDWEATVGTIAGICLLISGYTQSLARPGFRVGR